MKVMLLTCMTLLVMSSAHWETDFAAAKNKAKESRRALLLNFSGSDWCIPCIRMHKEIFNDKNFVSFSEGQLVLYQADFPRKKKNELPAPLRQQNDSIAAIYNPTGKFPFTVLLSPDGEVLRQWDGYPGGGLPALLNDIKKVTHASNH